MGAAFFQVKLALREIRSSLAPTTAAHRRRRRRLLFLLSAAPGFLAVATTPWHRLSFLMLAGFVMFGASAAFHQVFEPRLERLEAKGAAPPLKIPEAIRHG